jgi:hypothetical protein
MENTIWWRDLLLIIVPSIFTVGGLLFIIKLYFDNNRQDKLAELSIMQKQTTLPMKLQAYERLALMLERFKIKNLWFRLAIPNREVDGLQKTMALAIQQEFDHNLSQQIYVSDALWKIIISAKEQHQMDITLTTAKDEPALKEALFAIDDKHYIDIALNAIRHEIQLFL